ncbi:selenoprotein S isoform X2 [Spea bombifrons]|uniref:selenoprotein S isoform X2 n=1 Tax=Spea bombifrons TaxID=233779 RepID=UPI002348F427|nr:selenoprotein S isoform X2 [Spea bombifrons]
MSSMEQEGKVLAGPTEMERTWFLYLQETVGTVFSHYGWYILFGGVALMLLKNKLSPNIRQILGTRSGPRADPEEVVRRQEAMAAARLRMQEELDAQAEKFKEKQKLLEEEKRRRKLEGWKSSKVTYRVNQTEEPTPSTSTSSSVPKPKLERRPLRGSGYNPLTGDGGGACVWRPGRRGPSAGG